MTKALPSMVDQLITLEQKHLAVHSCKGLKQSNFKS